jgi:hypothetical protein
MVAKGYTVYDKAGSQWRVMNCHGDLRGTGGFQDVVKANLLGSGWLQVTVRSRMDPFPPMGLEPATYTSEASGLVSARYQLAYLKQLIMQTVHILQLNSAGTDSPPKEGFLQGNPNLLPNSLVRQ